MTPALADLRAFIEDTAQTPPRDRDAAAIRLRFFAKAAVHEALDRLSDGANVVDAMKAVQSAASMSYVAALLLGRN